MSDTHIGIVLVTRCGCKKYMKGFHPDSFREDVIVPLTPKAFGHWRRGEPPKTPEHRRFVRTAHAEVGRDEGGESLVYTVYMEE